MSVSFKPIKCNNAYRFLRKKKNKQWHSHTLHRDYPKNPKGKIQLRAFTALLVSFIALYRMFTIQYKVFTNLRNHSSKTRISKP